MGMSMIGTLLSFLGVVVEEGGGGGGGGGGVGVVGVGWGGGGGVGGWGVVGWWGGVGGLVTLIFIKVMLFVSQWNKTKLENISVGIFMGFTVSADLIWGNCDTSRLVNDLLLYRQVIVSCSRNN